MEDDHVVTFLNMQNKLKEQNTLATDFDPDDENLSYLKALADTRVFFKKDQPDDTFQSILKTAIQTEKDSIAFYLGMKELVPAKLGQAKIDDIIKEEMSHIKIIAEKLIEILMILDVAFIAGNDIIINWYYKAADEDMQEDGEMFNELNEAPINLIAV